MFPPFPNPRIRKIGVNVTEMMTVIEAVEIGIRIDMAEIETETGTGIEKGIGIGEIEIGTEIGKGDVIGTGRGREIEITNEKKENGNLTLRNLLKRHVLMLNLYLLCLMSAKQSVYSIFFFLSIFCLPLSSKTTTNQLLFACVFHEDRVIVKIKWWQICV